MKIVIFCFLKNRLEIETDPESQELLHKNGLRNFGGSHIETETIKNDQDHTQDSDDKTINGARTVLWYLSFLGFVINYMQRINLNIAIVGMVKKSGAIKSHDGILLNQSECFDDSISLDLFQSNVSFVLNATNINDPTIDDTRSTFSLERMFLDMMQV